MFLKNCGRGEGLGTTTCLKTVHWVLQGHAPCKYNCSNKASFMSVVVVVVELPQAPEDDPQKR